MKYHGFDSPLDWSQYLIQKADLHEYEPSEPGKRVETLLEKLYLPQNSYSYAKFPQWFADAADKGTEEEQVRYVMNHLCPNLYHFYENPTQRDFRLGPDVVNHGSPTYVRKHTGDHSERGWFSLSGWGP